MVHIGNNIDELNTFKYFGIVPSSDTVSARKSSIDTLSEKTARTAGLSLNLSTNDCEKCAKRAGVIATGFTHLLQ